MLTTMAKLTFYYNLDISIMIFFLQIEIQYVEETASEIVRTIFNKKVSL